MNLHKNTSEMLRKEDILGRGTSMCLVVRDSDSWRAINGKTAEVESREYVL
jgi:hypothetical protein